MSEVLSEGVSLLSSLQLFLPKNSSICKCGAGFLLHSLHKMVIGTWDAENGFRFQRILALSLQSHFQSLWLQVMFENMQPDVRVTPAPNKEPSLVVCGYFKCAKFCFVFANLALQYMISQSGHILGIELERFCVVLARVTLLEDMI